MCRDGLFLYCGYSVCSAKARFLLVDKDIVGFPGEMDFPAF
jgi:hypothetical protein